MNQYQYVKLFTFPLYLASLFLKLNLGRIKLTNRNWCEIALEILDSVFQGILIKSPRKGILKKEIIKSLLIFPWNLDSQVTSAHAPCLGFLGSGSGGTRVVWVGAAWCPSFFFGTCGGWVWVGQLLQASQELWMCIFINIFLRNDFIFNF